MYCRKCGAQISDSAKFCTKCGTAVVQNKVQNTEATTPVDTQLQESIPQDVQQQAGARGAHPGADGLCGPQQRACFPLRP